MSKQLLGPQILKISRELSANDIPDGRYAAVWCGYSVSFKCEGSNIVIALDKGIRGRADCHVVVFGDSITIEEARA